MGDLNLGGTAIKNCGESSGECNDVVTVKYIRNWINKWFPAQIIGWFRENARACFYFRTVDDFIQARNKIVGFKSQSKYYPIDARLEAGSLTSQELSTKRLCAVFPGSTCLSVTNTNITERELYVTVVVTVKILGGSHTKAQVYSDITRGLVVGATGFQVHGITDTKKDIHTSRGLNSWNTVWIEWGTTNDATCNVYIGMGVDVTHQTYTTSTRQIGEKLRIGGFQSGRQGMVGDIAAFEVHTTKYRLPEEIRELIFKDHQNIVE